jgi:YlmC/YmxH family sporulation protein
MSRGIDFKQKEVVNLNDGTILGFVVDVQADFQNGEINSIIVAKTGKLFGNVMGKNNITIPWTKIKKIGEDVILVDI